MTYTEGFGPISVRLHTRRANFKLAFDRGMTMKVEFHRTGERRYAVRVRRAGDVDLEMDPAPGYDARMPHDLVHFVVERELGIRLGIFGQIAAGGTAGTFRPIASAYGSTRDAARQRRALARRSAKLETEGRQDSARSERAADVSLRAWTVRRSQTGSNAERSADEHATDETMLTRGQLMRICDRLDEMSAQWEGLKVGEALTVQWLT